MSKAKYLYNQVLKCMYVHKQYPVFEQFLNKFTYNLFRLLYIYILITDTLQVIMFVSVMISLASWRSWHFLLLDENSL